MPSVIVPAHNEAQVLERCLRALLDGARAGELEVIVICNGCTDDSAAVVRRFGAGVKLIETPIASKIHALNLGDAAATTFPRFFIDGDVVLSLDALRRLARELEEGKLAAAPRARFDLAQSSWAVRAFYAVNDLLPSSREGIGGSGVYALSESGRKRFGRFPDLIADDGFVRVQFEPHERVTLMDCHSTVFAPRTLRELVRIKTRSHLGTAQLRQLYPQCWSKRGPTNGAALRALLRRPAMWAKLAVYCYVKGMARLRAGQKLRASKLTWERDDGSRSAQAALAT